MQYLKQNFFVNNVYYILHYVPAYARGVTGDSDRQRQSTEVIRRSSTKPHSPTIVWQTNVKSEPFHLYHCNCQTGRMIGGKRIAVDSFTCTIKCKCLHLRQCQLHLIPKVPSTKRKKTIHILQMHLLFHFSSKPPIQFF